MLVKIPMIPIAKIKCKIEIDEAYEKEQWNMLRALVELERAWNQAQQH